MYEPRHSRIKTFGRFGYFLCAILVFGSDQASKNAIVASLHHRESLPVIPGFFHLTFIMNSGASFGILQNRRLLFVGMTILVIVFICWAVFFLKGINTSCRLLLGVITGGALGNLADRLQYGAVVDFLDFRGIWSYIFNIADMAVVCGGIALAAFVLFDEWKGGRLSARH